MGSHRPQPGAVRRPFGRDLGPPWRRRFRYFRKGQKSGKIAENPRFRPRIGAIPMPEPVAPLVPGGPLESALAKLEPSLTGVAAALGGYPARNGRRFPARNGV